MLYSSYSIFLGTNVPTVAAFLSKIKRDCEQYVTKIPTWEALFTMDSQSMEKAGIPCQARKRILSWVNKYRYGVEPYYIPPSDKLKRKAKAKAANAKK